MKRLFLLFTCIVVANMAFAGNDRAITVEQLPATAQQLISKYFTGVEVSYAKEEVDFFDKSYEVVLVNGCKVEFDKKGDWKEVDCKYAEVPMGIVPQKIQDFITQKHPGTKVIEIDRDSRDYEVKLSNRIELKFDLKQNFMGYDS